MAMSGGGNPLLAPVGGPYKSPVTSLLGGTAPTSAPLPTGYSNSTTGAGLPTPSTSPTTPTPAGGPMAPPPGGSSAPPTYGTESGPGILQQWFGERANGADPGYEYATKRGLTAINNEAAARGGFNGGASEQQDSDYLANMGSQREGQLDTLASGASGERGNQLSTMLGFGTGLAGSEAGLGSAYDLGGANAMSGANNAGLGYGAQAAMIQYLANQGFLSNLMKM